MTPKHKYPVIEDIGLVVRDTFPIEFSEFGKTWKFHVRSKSEENISKSCLTYYKEMWEPNSNFAPISKEDVIVDIGAHVGFFTIPIAHKVQKVYSFEPAPANFELLFRNINLNPLEDVDNIVICPSAVDRYTGEVVLSLGVQGTTGHSTVINKRGGVRKVVQCMSIQDVVKGFSPTVLKIDCEGSEWDILSDPDPLKNVRIIIAELHKVNEQRLEKLESVLTSSKMKFEMKHNSWFSKLTAWRK